MSIDKEQLKRAIQQVLDNPKLDFSINEQGQLAVVERSSFPSRKNENKKVANFIKENQKEVQQVVDELYAEGKDCTVFQDKINKLYKKSEAPNFIKNYTASWMSKLPDNSKDMLLTDLMLPGTHDSGANKINFSKIPAFIKKPWQKLLFRLAALPIVSNIINNWVITQDKPIQEQLESGTRLLDFRLGKDDKGELCLSHTFVLGTFKESLQQVKTFLEKHPDEVVVINLKVDSPYSDSISKEDQENAAKMINAELGHLMKDNISISNTSIKGLVEKGNRAVVYANLNLSSQSLGKIKAGSSHEIWPNKTQEKDVVSAVKTEITKPDNANLAGKELIYASLNTTPNTGSIIKGVFTDNLVKRGKHIQDKEGEKFLDIQSQKTNLSGVILDSPTPKFVQRILAKNVAKAKNPTPAKKSSSMTR